MTNRLLDPERTHKLARSFAFEWLSPSGAPLTPTGCEQQAKLETLLLAFAAVLVRDGSAPAPATGLSLEDALIAAFIHAEDEYQGCKAPEAWMAKYERAVPFWCFWNRPKEPCAECADFKAHVTRHFADIYSAEAESAARIAQLRDGIERVKNFSRHKVDCTYREAWTDYSGTGMEDMSHPIEYPARPCTCGLSKLFDKLDALLTPAAQEKK